MAIETWMFVQEKSKQAMEQVLGIKDETARLRVTPPLAVAESQYFSMSYTCLLNSFQSSMRPLEGWPLQRTMGPVPPETNDDQQAQQDSSPVWAPTLASVSASPA